MKTWNIEIATRGLGGRWIACGDVTADTWDGALIAARVKARGFLNTGEKLSDCICSRLVSVRASEPV